MQEKMIDRIPVCPHLKREDIDPYLVLSLERLEKEIKTPLEFSSGYRCPACNAAAGGVKNSAHLRGKAVDILADTSGERFLLVSAALAQGFSRVGVGKRFVHLDVDTSLPAFMLWLY